MPASREDPERIARSLDEEAKGKARGRLLWLGGQALERDGSVTLHSAGAELCISGNEDEIGWLLEVLEAASPQQEALLLSEAKDAFPGSWRNFESRFALLRELGLLVL